SQAFVETVAAATEGNPLFVAELTEHLLDQNWEPDRDQSGGGAIPVPIGVRETLAQRLATLSPAGQALVRGGAVLGRTFDTDIAATLAALEPDRVLGAT